LTCFSNNQFNRFCLHDLSIYSPIILHQLCHYILSLHFVTPIMSLYLCHPNCVITICHPNCVTL